MKVHFLRHAESIFNAHLTSEKDCELTEKGKAQASEVEGEYDIVFCSIMKRTRMTLALSKLKYNQIIYTDLCREKRSDICDFLVYEEQSETESMEELTERIKRFTYFLRSQVSPSQSILVVSHGDFINTLGKQSQSYPKNAEIQVHEV